MGIPVLRGSGLEGFYCTDSLQGKQKIPKVYDVFITKNSAMNHFYILRKENLVKYSITLDKLLTPLP